MDELFSLCNAGEISLSAYLFAVYGPMSFVLDVNMNGEAISA